MRNRTNSKANTILLSGSEMMIPFGDLPIKGVLVLRPEPNVFAFWDLNEWVPLTAASWRSKFAAAAPEIPVGSWCVINRLRLAGGTRFMHSLLNQHSFLLAFRNVGISEVPLQTLPDMSDQGGAVERDEINEEVRDYVAGNLA